MGTPGRFQVEPGGVFWRPFLFQPLPTILLLWVEQVSQGHIIGLVLEVVDFLVFCKALLIWPQQVEEGELLVTEVRAELVVKEAGKMAPMHLVVTEAPGDQAVRLEEVAEQELPTALMVTIQVAEMGGMVEIIALQVLVVVVLVLLLVLEELRQQLEGKVEMVVLAAAAAAAAAVGVAPMIGFLLVVVVVVVMQVVAVEA